MMEPIASKSDEGLRIDLPPPKDRYHLIYMIMMLQGFGILIPWNMFITAKEYFVQYKLKDTVYADSFLVYVGYASQLPNFIFSWLNVFVNIGGDLSNRIVWSIFIEAAIFVFTIVLAMADTSKATNLFFWLTMISIFFLNGFNAIFQNSVYGVAAKLPPKYTGSLILGANVAGCVVVFINWISYETAGSPRTSAIYYFIAGIFVLLACFDSYLALPLNRFYRYHTTVASQQHNQALQKTPYLSILKKIWIQIYNVFITFFVTLAVFPAVHSDVLSVRSDSFLRSHFVLVTCFLTFNVTATLGNISASLWQIPSRRWLFILTTVRLVFIPLFLLCNYQPHAGRTMRVLISSDLVYWIIAVAFGLTHGHASSLSMMYVSGNVAPEYAPKAGMLGGATLITGILVGISFSGLCARIVGAPTSSAT